MILYKARSYDNYENMADLFSLISLLFGSCADSTAEQCNLVYIGNQFDVKVLITPKFCKGIDYSWGVFTSKFRKIPLYDRKIMVNFRFHTDDCLRTIENFLLNVRHIRKFSQRSRCYRLLYYTIERQRSQ